MDGSLGKDYKKCLIGTTGRANLTRTFDRGLIEEKGVSCIYIQGEFGESCASYIAVPVAKGRVKKKT